MPSNSRSENQYYGKYRECCVVAHLNNEPVQYNENYEFTDVEKEEMFQQTKLIADYLGAHTATYSGNHTANESGDIILDNGDVVELKCVSEGTGTYFNTSIYYFTKFGFDFKNYLTQYGLYDALEEHFGSEFTISRTNNSPVSQTNSSKIRHNYEDKYKKYIIPIDEQTREQFTKDLATYFTQNAEQLQEFILDMINKNTSTSKKAAPNRLIILNYKKNTIREINLTSLVDNISTSVQATNKGLVVGNIRIALSWQNGVGLNNPTIRIFLED